MKDVSFYEIIITRDDQRIVSADAWIYDAFGSYATKPMNELIGVEDTGIYENNIRNCDGKWYPSKLVSPNRPYYTYMSAQRYNDELIRLTVVDADDLLNAHSTLMKTINSFMAQLSLYEDVFFEYDPVKDTISVYNTDLSDFETKTYSLSEFENILLARTDDDQKHILKGFISQVKSGVGRSDTMIQGNILNDDSSVTNTLLNESFVFYDKDTEGVVGHIQLQRGKESVKSTFIKYDSLTGLVDKTDIIRIAKERIDDRGLEGTSLVIIDVDYFKNINDSYGHQYGDVVIKKVADIISNEVGNFGVAGRFGGDEFFVVLYDIQSEEHLKSILRGIKTKVSATFPDKGIDKDNPLSVSIGAAVYPKDADNYDELFMLSDHCLYLSKEKGRNRYTVYSEDAHGTIDDIRLKHQNAKLINDREISYGDVIVKLFDKALHDDGGTVEDYVREFADAFSLPNVNLYVGTPFEHRCSAGSKVIDDQTALDFVIDILNSDAKDKYFSLGEFMVVNNIELLPPYAYYLKKFLAKRGVYSFIITRFFDRDKRECILIISGVGKKIQWNQTRFKYYRAFTDLLSLHSLGTSDTDS